MSNDVATFIEKWGQTGASERANFQPFCDGLCDLLGLPRPDGQKPDESENYIHALPASEGRPPFLIVVDVGHSIELYSEFTCTGGIYVPYPEPRSHRIYLRDLEKDSIRATLHTIWTDPFALDPARRAARVTREIADRLATLAKSLEASGHSPAASGGFLMRCIFTMFAEDVQIAPPRQLRGALALHS